MNLQFDYYYGAEAEQFSFYRVPRMLIKDENFKRLSSDAKLLYGLMLDRMSLSIKNGWFDNHNRAYIIYTIDNIMEDLGCGKDKAVKVVAELDLKKGIGLIEKVRRGLGKPDLIYVKNFINSKKEAINTEESTEVGKTEIKKLEKSNSRKYYTLKEMDSIRIYDKSHWFRWSRQYEQGNNGGSQIDFLRVFCGMDVKSAVFWLLDFAGYGRITEAQKKIQLKHQVEGKKEERKPFVLPMASYDNTYLYSYLKEVRGIRKEVIDYFVNQGLIYESRNYHNIVFKGNDKYGKTRFASQRGVFDKEGKSFKCDVAGNDKNFGFNVVNEGSEELIVFEAAIDLMSYVDIFNDFNSNKLALGILF